VPGKDLPNVGRFAVIGDPQGSVIALFTPLHSAGNKPQPPQTRPVVLAGWLARTGDDGLADRVRLLRDTLRMA
jgi:hypothetical protein